MHRDHVSCDNNNESCASNIVERYTHSVPARTTRWPQDTSRSSRPVDLRRVEQRDVLGQLGQVEPVLLFDLILGRLDLVRGKG
jgi:hypothetical protein